MAASNKKSAIHILHVDDDPLFLETSKLILLDMDNFEIDNACCVDEALKKLSTGQYDVVVSDYEMPQKDGLQFLRGLRELNIQIPFILFTGKGREEVAIKALNLGADGYHNKQGSPETIYGELVHNIRSCIEHQKAKQNLIKTEAKYSYLFSNMLNGFGHCKMIYDKENKPVDFVYLEVNDAFTKLTGLKKEDVIGKKVTEIIPEIDKTNPELFEIYGRVALTGKEEQFELFFNPIKIWLSITVYSPEKGYFIALFDNITERKNAEEKLSGTLEVLERMGEGVDAGLAVISKDYQVIWANKHLMDLGVSPKKKCYQTFNRLASVCPDCGVKKIFDQNLFLDVHEFKTVNAKGETTWIELRVTPLKDKNGNTTAALELAISITERKKAEQILTENESKYRLLADNMSDVIWMTDIDGHFIYVSPSVLHLSGYTSEEVMKHSIFEALTPASAQLVLESMQYLQETGQISSRSFDLEHPCKDGSTVWTESNFTILRDEKGEPRSILGASRSITKRMKAEEENRKLLNMLKKSEDQLRAVIANAPIGIAISDSKMNFLSANKKFCKILGYEEEELQKFNFKNITFSEDISQSIAKMDELSSGKIEFFNQEKRYIRKDGTIIFGKIMVNAIRDKEDKPVLFVAELEDITFRKEQERAEKTKSDEIQGIVEGIGDFLFVMDKNRVITKVNKPTCDLFKKTPEELIRRHCFEIMHNADAPWCNCPASKTFKTKQIVTEEVDDPNLGIPLLVTTSPILDEKGEVAQIIHIAKDITKIKQAEMEMHIAANLFGAASDSILVHDLDGKLVYFNEAAYRTRGYTRDEFQALTIRDLEVPDNPRFFGTRLNELVELGETTFEAYNLCKDKTVLPVEVHAQLIESNGRKIVLSVARDISGRKAAEEKLAESQEKYETSFESSMDALMLLDENSFLDCNAETLRLFGFNSVNEFTKKHPADLSPELQPDGSSSLISANNHIKKALWCGRDNFFWVHKQADGTTFPADVLLSRITLKNRILLQATVRDITDQKEAEEKLRESGRRIEMMNEKLRVVGSLTRHDVRNKLSAVTGYAYILKKKHGDLVDVVDGLSKMEQAVAETVRIFDFAKMYEQIGVEELTYVSVEEKLKEAVALFSGLIPTIKNECQGLMVLADSFLRQLFYNFIDNTRKYGKKTTTIRVYYEKMDKDGLKLVYEDDGVGVPFENKPSLFKEGFSTGGSTGFGLFLIKNMIDVYGWRIEENGVPGKGAKFTITIPKLNKNGEENYQI